MPVTSTASDIATAVENSGLTELRFREAIPAPAQHVAHTPPSPGPGPREGSAAADFEAKFAVPPAPITSASPDLLAGALTSSPDSTAAGRGGRKKALIAGGAVATAALLGVVVTTLLVTGGDSTPSEPITAASTPSAASSASASPDNCEASTDGTRTIGNGPGDQTSGPNVIMAFNHAYYVTRSAKAARAVTRGNVTQEEAVLQTYIDKVSPEAKYCITIDDRGGGLYAVKLSVLDPADVNSPDVPAVFPQLIQTIEAEGKTWITSFLPDETAPA